MCFCGKYKRIRYSDTVQTAVGVEATQRRFAERMGHIELKARFTYLGNFKGIEAAWGSLGYESTCLEVIYFAAYVVIDPAGHR